MAQWPDSKLKVRIPSLFVSLVARRCIHIYIYIEYHYI